MEYSLFSLIWNISQKPRYSFFPSKQENSLTCTAHESNPGSPGTTQWEGKTRSVKLQNGAHTGRANPIRFPPHAPSRASGSRLRDLVARSLPLFPSLAGSRRHRQTPISEKKTGTAEKDRNKQARHGCALQPGYRPQASEPRLPACRTNNRQGTDRKAQRLPLCGPFHAARFTQLIP